MSAPKKPTPLQMPRLYTVEDIIERTGISPSSVCARMKSRAPVIGPYQQLRGVYVFSELQFEKLCESWGRGQDAIRRHMKVKAKTATAASPAPRRRKAS